jgi:hypothetical protein
MSETLFDLTLRVAIELGIVRQSTATGGSTNTIVDTNLLATLDDDYYNLGTYWITDTTDDAAPEKESGVIASFVGSTGTATLQDAVSAVVAAGDKFAMAVPRYKLYELVQQINNALYVDGYVPHTDVSLTTVADQREYTLPQAATLDLRDVLIYTNGDSDLNIPKPAYNWVIRYSTTGSQDTLVLNEDYPAGQTMELVYAAQHEDLEVSSDKLNDAIHPDRVVFAAAAAAMRAYRDRTRLKHLDSTIEMLDNKAEIAKQRHPLPPLPSRRSKLTILGNRMMDHGQFGSEL